jgi:hypothetical protein
VENSLSILKDEEEAGDNNCINGVGRVAQGMRITMSESTVLEASTGGSGFCSCDQALREIYAGGVNLGILL